MTFDIQAAGFPGPRGTTGAPGGNISAIGLFVDASGLNVPVGTNVVKTSGYSTDGIGSAEYVHDPLVDAAYVAANPRSSFIAADGRGFRLSLDQRINAAMFGVAGAVGDGPAMAAAVAFVIANRGSNLTDYGQACPTLHVPFYPTAIDMGTTTLTLTQAVAIVGESGGEFGGEATVLKWSASHAGHGLEFTAPNWWIDGVAFEGPHPAGTATEAEQHGIHATARGGWGRLWVRGWPGDGVHIEASVAGGTNANGCRGFSLTANNNRNGVRLSGSDVNGGYFAFIDANYNRQAGYYDDGAFGNGIGTLQTSGNGVTGLGTPCMCFNSGHLFTVADGQATGASTNGPPSTATSNTWWLYCRDIGAATAYAPQWTTGLTWRCGGAIYTPNSATSNHTSIVHLYAEADQPVVQTGPAVMSYGGLNAAGWGSRSNFANPNTALGGLEISKLVVTDKLIFIPKYSLSGFILDSRTAAGGNGGDFGLNFYHGNVRTDLIFHDNSGAMCAQFTALSSFGSLLDCGSGLAHRIRVNGADIHITDSTGINVQAGKVLKINGTQVVGARQTGTASNATDLPSAITLVNDLRAKLIAHGLIS